LHRGHKVIIRPWIYGPKFSACVCVELENMDLGLVCMWDRDSYLLCVRGMGVYGPRFSVCVCVFGKGYMDLDLGYMCVGLGYMDLDLECIWDRDIWI
jgi:hypothetical protein